MFCHDVVAQFYIYILRGQYIQFPGENAYHFFPGLRTRRPAWSCVMRTSDAVFNVDLSGPVGPVCLVLHYYVSRPVIFWFMCRVLPVKLDPLGGGDIRQYFKGYLLISLFIFGGRVTI